MIQTIRPLDIHGQGLYSSYSYDYPMDLQKNLFSHSTQSEHSSSDSSVSPLIDGAKKPNSGSLKRQNSNILEDGKQKEPNPIIVPKKRSKQKQKILKFLKECGISYTIPKIKRKSEPAIEWKLSSNKNLISKLRKGSMKWELAIIKARENKWTYFRNYYKNVLSKNINYKIEQSLRSRMFKCLKGEYKSKNFILSFGCSIEEFKQHLERQFTFGMNWKNWGYGWHIDHIKPVSKFDLTEVEEQKKCFYYTNLQPLWAIENIKKGNKFN